MITLYKGDDTGGQLGKNVKIVFHCDDAVDMDDVVVKFDLLGIVKREFTDVHDGDVLDIFISHAESRKFPLGVIFAKMWGEDASGKLRTFANRIPFRVTLNLIAVYGSDGTDSQDIHVYSSVDWDSIANKPTVFPSSVEDVEGLQEELDDINGKIPFDASADNQLADKEWVDQAIDRVAAYYITYTAAGAAFPTRADLLNAQTYYSGGVARVPTRNDYAVVLADEAHGGAEYRYIYAVAEGQTTGSWQPQFPVEGVMTVDQTVQKDSQNPVSGGGVWSAIWGALASLPTGFSSLYDWCVAQLAGKASKADATLTERGFSEWNVVCSDPTVHGFIIYDGDSQKYQLYDSNNPDWLFDETEAIWPEDSATSLQFRYLEADFTFVATRETLPGYRLGPDDPSNPNRDKPLASEAEAEALRTGKQNALTPQQLANIAAVSDALVFDATHSYAAGDPVVYNGTLYTFTSAHTGAWTGSDVSAVNIIARLAGKLDKSGGTMTGPLTVDFDAPDGDGWLMLKRGNQIGIVLHLDYISLAGKDYALPAATGTLALLENLAGNFSSSTAYAEGALVVYLGALYRCVYSHMGAWMAADFTPATVEDVLAALRTAIAGKADASDLLAKLDSTSAAPAFSSDSSTQYAVGAHVTYNGKLYKCTTATTGGTWVAGSWAEDTMTDPDAVLDITAQNQLRVVAKDGTLLWAQGYDLASTSSATLACDATNNFTFADGATTQAFTLPTAPTGKVGDFGLDIDNSANTGAATLTLTGLDSTFSVVVPEGESLNDMLAIAAGELARFYITLSTFRVNNLPTWHIVKQVVENGGATV